jgi:hypothetical protein
MGRPPLLAAAVPGAPLYRMSYAISSPSPLYFPRILFFNERIHMVIYRNVWAVLCAINAFILLPDFNMSHA